MNFITFIVLLLCSKVFSQNELVSTEETTVTYTNSSIFGRVWNSTGMNTVLLPKCCPFGFSVGFGTCNQTTINFEPKFDVHDHNDTAFDDNPILPALIKFEAYVHNPCKGRKFPLSPEEGPKILLNGSLLVAGLNEYDGILDHEQFCVDNVKESGIIETDSNVYAFICIKEQNDDYPQWIFSTYVTLITISALLFSSSAVFFYRQDVQGVHKKSYMIYAFAMSATYIIIILMQFISGGCKGLGLLLQFFITLSFAWLAILCIDLAWSIHYYNKSKDHADRFVIYIGVSAVYCVIFLLNSITNSFTPDIPNSFFKPQFQKNTCSNFENQRQFIFFGALILSIVISIIGLCYSLIKMNQNRYKNTAQGVAQWKRVSGKLRYMYGRMLITFVTMFVWFLDSFSGHFDGNSGLSIFILFIQAFQGFIVVPLFTWRYLHKVIDVNNKPRIENLEELIEVGKSYERV